MVIKVLGSGCKKCKQLEQNVKEALDQSGVEAEVVKVEDMQQIMSYGVMSTPALVVDEQLVSSGKVLKEKEIVKLISK
ncbi:thioredoxin family protein [Bacillus marinisedimentorum]|uniref:thioredoxin family protein n=1 Tax=Bacillus marinisedimentorum TaxID=1821260 RepID=UPI0007E243EA|nr:thioredoxin family protein [Bacillus marinisedimentorum]